MISATVSGTELYEVEIFLDHDEVYDMDCDCPYAEDGNYCKHMAAVLYELENTDITEKSSVKESIADIVNQEWARLLKRMRKIEGGRELAKQITADWRIRYKNRSAMMDELKGL